MANVIIYGAQSFAMTIYAVLKKKNIPILCFAVSDISNNPQKIDGIPVVEIKNLLQHKNSAKIMIAVSLTPATLQNEVIDNLQKLGFENIIPLTNDSLNEMLFEYHKPQGLPILASGGKEPQSDNAEILQVASPYDKPLQNTYANSSFVKIFFNDSPKSRNYCELLATYHLWKNSKAELKGICHYRRVFCDISSAENIDVILPMPFVFYPNIYAQRKRFTPDEDWNAALQAIEELYAECLDEFKRIQNDKILYSFNMVAAKAKIFDDYAKFLFAILERVEEIRGDERVRQDRYLGYIGESLTDFYFKYNAKKLRIWHTKLEWRV